MKRLILGESKVVEDLIKLIHQVAATKTNVLIIGESGTGKELVARMIHSSGPLKDRPFIPVNCGAIPENLIETELFGHHKGSFTGAIQDKQGLFEAADQGTLFLDEVGELSLSMQVKLLRAIQERVFRKVGGVQDVRVDVRIIAATNRDLEAAVKKGTFREDLYYRLNVILIRTPPLREREGDVQILAESFLKTLSQKARKEIKGFEPEALQCLYAYPWPGNVRELENVIERAVTLESSEKIQLQSLPLGIQSAREGLGSPRVVPGTSKVLPSPYPFHVNLPKPDFENSNLELDQILLSVEKAYIEAALKYAGDSKQKAADVLGINFRSLRYRIRKLGLS